MARNSHTESVESQPEPVKGEAPRRRRAATGPRVAKPTHAVFAVTDAQGNPVQDAKLSLVHATKDAEKLVEYIEQNQGKGYARARVPANFEQMAEAGE